MVKNPRVNGNRPMTKWSRRAALAGGAALAGAGGYFAFRRPSGDGFNLSRGDPRILHRGNSAEPSTLDPHKASTLWEDWIMGDMFVGLMHQDPAGNPIPAACEKLEESADGLTYIATLRDHVWSDGVKVTAYDYEFSFRRIADPRTAAQYVSILYPIRNMQEAASGKLPPSAVGVTALDEKRLKIEVIFQTPYINQLLMHQTTYAVPRHVVEKYGDAWLRPEHIVTNGPFILKEWIPNDHIRLVRNPRFFAADSVHFSDVYFYPTEDSSAALKRFRAGELDLSNRCPPTSQVPILRRQIPDELKISPMIANYFLPLNQTRKPFTDRRLRLALALAVDREVIVDKVLRVGQIPAYGIVPTGMPGYPYSAALRFRPLPMEKRLEQARALVREAGYGPSNPLRFELSIYNSIEFKLVAVALQAMWHQIGVDMRLAPIDAQILYDMLRKRDFEAASAGWVADYRDPKNFLFLFQTSSPDLNYGGYSNPVYDELVAQSDHIRDPAARLRAMARAEQVLLDDVGVVPLYNDVTRDLVSPQVKGWISNPVNFNRSRWLSLDRSVTRV
jgi:oligopeptide transport system substrate-binding protein